MVASCQLGITPSERLLAHVTDGPVADQIPGRVLGRRLAVRAAQNHVSRSHSIIW
jgi:hypothetical protein